MKRLSTICLLGALLLIHPSYAAPDNWWPAQKAPKGVLRMGPHGDMGTVVSPNGQSNSGHLGAGHMLVESLAGLAAAAVNAGELDEMIWIDIAGNKDYDEWRQRIMERLAIEDRGFFKPWEAAKRLTEKGIVKGYILYAYDYSEGNVYEPRKEMNESSNVATSLAGILQGMIVEEGQEAQAKELGLSMLADARGMSMEECFEKHKDQFNRSLVLVQDPKVPHCRDISIAHKCFALYEMNEFTRKAMEWLNPLTPIIGWNIGDEFKQTELVSDYGHFQTATNWCINLPFLMAGAADWPIKRTRNIDPTQIDWSDARTAAAFVLSDGDNTGWLIGSIYRLDDKSYWNSPAHGKFPFGWTTSFSQMTQVCPQGIDYAHETQPETSTMQEFGGGYYYPDLFGRKREDKTLLAQHARQVWSQMNRAGEKVMTVNCQNALGPDAVAAYETYAKEMPGLWAIFAIQYAPYEGGDGKILWVKRADGVEIPVITAKYAIWGNANAFGPRIGTPARVARLINESAAAPKDTEESVGHWTVVHAWSFFKKAPGSDEEAENMPQEKVAELGGLRGLEPVGWCVERLSQEIHVVTPEELVWRVRMKHNRDETIKESRKIKGME